MRIDDVDDDRSDETAPMTTFPPAGVSLDKAPSTTAGPFAQDPAPSLVPSMGPPAQVVTPPAGWYPQGSEQRYWDGSRWTEHTAPAPAPVYYPAYSGPVVMTDARPSGAETAIAWVLTVLTLGYFLPWAIAATRGTSNSLAVGLVNFLVGWTIVGWVVALVMACSAHRVTYVHHRG